MTFIIFLAILSLLVIIHELGHFLAAKKNGVKVEEFGLGLPPRIFGKKIGETIYSFNLLPFGGFVKLYGEEYHEVSSDKKKAFVFKKPWQKVVIISAGVLMNFIFGVVLMYLLLGLNQFKSSPVPKIFKDHTFAFGQEQKKVIITQVTKGSPADKAGIVPQDIVLGYWLKNENYKSIGSAQQFIETIKQTKDQSIKLVLVNNKNGQKKIVTVNPAYNEKLKRHIIGVNLIDVVVLRYETTGEKFLSGFFHSYNLIDYNLKIFNQLIASAFREKKPGELTQSLTGPIGIFALVDETVKESGERLFLNLLELSSLISLSLALMNILPFPALDGGRLIFVLFEWLTGRPVNKNIEKYVNLVGFLILITLAIFISINDFLRFF
ncbi:MAG: M50 family metallopeptidase [Patescibacteria group bacterium]|nr:M50 family metallopeptidase [Patescibacteria group bacterium]